ALGNATGNLQFKPVVCVAVREPRLFLAQKFETPVEFLKDAAALGELEPSIEPGKGCAGSLERGAVLGEQDPALAGCFVEGDLDFHYRRAGCGCYGRDELERGCEARDPPCARELRVPAKRAA